MKNLAKVLLLAGLCFAAKLALAVPADDLATCSISVTVTQIMEWADNFAAISLTTISAQADAPEDNKTQTIYTNCDFEIGADTSIAAQLSLESPADTLVTKYKLSYDGDGVTATGGSDISTWTDYSAFLPVAGESAVTHFNGDGAVQVTLYVQATNPSGEVANAGDYTAIQTLTASWTSD